MTSTLISALFIDCIVTIPLTSPSALGWKRTGIIEKPPGLTTTLFIGRDKTNLPPGPVEVSTLQVSLIDSFETFVILMPIDLCLPTLVGGILISDPSTSNFTSFFGGLCFCSKALKVFSVATP
ncbi:hypothetical protein RirG_019540 [Rhizophagus irregularis DAOM 197198w]|uniref:Uncharacterized protein n=1 Tax=Rhizophagus irregularis (strain DAOM 197198w) TaxID=1432141 RepID=A0A015LDX2_RHIIW|nr:hypothetical protein RirG_019540 [Rhizophagus irregularis DAOM 197198w]